LAYKAIKVKDKKIKYEKLIEILKGLERDESGKNPTIIYIPQNARQCSELSKELQEDERLHLLNLVIEPFCQIITLNRSNKFI
jgi:ATP-dependent DNA helicase RecQ